jgi:phytoene dehydrogenase-like protein
VARVPDAVVIGSGPNGLAAAITLARAELVVDVYEGSDSPGGGCRTEELTLPGFLHDTCAAVHPLLAESPFFDEVDLESKGVKLGVPPVAFAHPLDGGRGAAALRSLEETSARLGTDSTAYRRLLTPLVRDVDLVVPTLLSPLRSLPAHPLATARFGAIGIWPFREITRLFHTDEARGLLAGAAAHSMMPLSSPLTAAYGLLFAMMAHSSGWPVVQGGSGQVVDALVTELEALGGRLETGHWVRSLEELPRAKVLMFDTSTRDLLHVAGDRLPARYRRSLRRFRYGPGVCKVDWALEGPVPWTSPECRAAGTVHLGGTFEEIALSESEVASGRHAERPYCLVAQPGVVDQSRAPAGRQTLWAYCHVPSGSTVDMTERIESQIERFAPGFRDLVLARVTKTASQTERRDPNCVGGDVSGGLATLRQTLFRPTVSWCPYRTPLEGVYLCSASTPPGGGVHGMCGLHAAEVALHDVGVRRTLSIRRS